MSLWEKFEQGQAEDGLEEELQIKWGRVSLTGAVELTLSYFAWQVVIRIFREPAR
ncbi:MAG: hypothetical protein HFH89_07715 [Lachnospiraceae bacterium]|nr:hypothetical protein [uncultured Acetatifactor sp.]MCI8287523.1 hypothetical protein [Lachnospiraceae bacterium]